MVNKKVYCVIVTYNAMKWINKCLNSLRNSTVDLSTVVVDNSSSDDTVKFIFDNFPEVHIIVNKDNRGFGQANNQGIEYAYSKSATHFFLLNQDAYIQKDTIKKLVDVQDEFNIEIVSPVHLNGNGKLLDHNFFAYSVLRDKNINFVSDLMLNTLRPFYPATTINAAAWMLSRKTIEHIGGFDPIFFHYGEDGNYCQRVRYHQGEVAFVPGSYIFHDREIKGNITVFKKNATSSMLLNKYSDINKSVWKIDKVRVMLHLYNLKLAFMFLITMKWRDLGNLFSSYFGLIKNFSRMKRNMTQNTRVGPNWLNLK